jgi:hypothetical protein
MKKKHRVMGLFSNFREAFNVIDEIGSGKIAGLTVDDVRTISPIEHPEIDEILGERPSPVPKFTLTGAIFGPTFGFLFLTSAQASFLVQPQGGKAVVPLPSNFVLTYELLILFSVIFTVVGFIVSAGLPHRRNKNYSERVGVDQIGIELEVDDAHAEALKAHFKAHGVLEIREEVVK